MHTCNRFRSPAHNPFPPVSRSVCRTQANPRRQHSVTASAAAPTATKLTLHVDQTSISFPLKVESGKSLQAALQTLLQTFAEKQKAERPQRWKSMEFKVKGQPEEGQVQYLEIFCNPNASSTAFDAKALITVKTADGLELTTEGRLSALKADLDLFLEQA